MTDKDTGGPAFPWCGDLNECPTINLGMTLRDYFAIHSLAACNLYHKEHKAIWAYQMADAMLKARGHD